LYQKRTVIYKIIQSYNKIHIIMRVFSGRIDFKT